MIREKRWGIQSLDTSLGEYCGWFDLGATSDFAGFMGIVRATPPFFQENSQLWVNRILGVVSTGMLPPQVQGMLGWVPPNYYPPAIQWHTEIVK
jgi:hypothetical protein